MGDVVRDPLIVHGPYRVLGRTDGKWALCDERRPAGDRTVNVFASKEEAAREAKRRADDESRRAG